MENTHSNNFTISVTILRVLTSVFLLIALVIIATFQDTVSSFDGPIMQRKFDVVKAYRYMLSTIGIGFAYNLLQLAFSIFTLVSRRRALGGDFGYHFDFFGDKIISYLLISGCAAGFGLSMDLLTISPSDPLLKKGNTSAFLLLIGFLFNAITSIFTSFALPKKAN